MRHINFFSGRPKWCALGGGQKVYVETVCALFPSPNYGHSHSESLFNAIISKRKSNVKTKRGNVLIVIETPWKSLLILVLGVQN